MRIDMLAIILLGMTALVGCDDDDGIPGLEIIIAGDPEGADYFSDLSEPDTMLFTNIHTSMREIDLDGDQVMDIRIVSERDTLFDGNIPASTTRRLSIQAVNPQNNTVFISTLNQEGRVYGIGEVINRNNAIWTTLMETPIILAASDQNLTNGQTEEMGNWNSLRNKCLGFLLPRETERMAWLEITVLGVDSWVYNDHAAFELD